MLLPQGQWIRTLVDPAPFKVLEFHFLLNDPFLQKKGARCANSADAAARRESACKSAYKLDHSTKKGGIRPRSLELQVDNDAARTGIARKFLD